MRIAAVDVGSNSIHMVVVETDGVEAPRVLAREKVMVGLAQGEAITGEIDPEALQAGLIALKQMVTTIRQLNCDHVMACGTAALREAKNAKDFLRAATKMGISIQVISGEEEARLIHEAVSHAYPFPEGVVALMDIGGGSTELTWVEGGKVLASVSVPLGLQRLVDAFPTQDPPTVGELSALKRALRKQLKKHTRNLPNNLPFPHLILGTSGTLEDLARCGGDGDVLDLSQLRSLRRNLWSLSAKKRVQRLATVDPRRAAMLHVGAVWGEVLMQWLGASILRHLPVGLREGMIWEALRHGGQLIPPLPERRRASVDALAQRTDPDPVHSVYVQQLAEQLFDDLRVEFELGDQEREWISCAARLHDIGFAIAEKDHHKHGAYMIQHGDLQGFWREELAVIAQIVRYHRGKKPDSIKHAAFAALEPWHQGVVLKLASILRLADALDRRRDQRIQRVRLRLRDEEVVLSVTSENTTRELRPEREAVESKGALLEKLLGRPLRWVQAPRRPVRTPPDSQNGYAGLAN
jgi:exopolyphosphatase / guanosine-5'-triphosphate,3'-diphosphate pyrophosphatase